MGSHERNTDEYSWGVASSKQNPRDAYVHTDTTLRPGGVVPVMAPQYHVFGAQTDAKPSPAPHPQVCSFTLFERCLFALASVFVTLASVVWLLVVYWGYLTLKEMGAALERIGNGVY